MLKRKRNVKSLYVLKNADAELKDLEAKKKSESKQLYVVRARDEVTNKYCDIIYDFVDAPGLFILVTRDRTFYQTFKQALSYELGIEMDFIKVASDVNRAAQLLQFYAERGVRPFLFLEHALDAELTLSFLRFAKKTYKDLIVTILSREVNRERLFQFFEEGATSFLKKPASANSIISKIAFCVHPQSEADTPVQVAREHVESNRFEEAIPILESVLQRWPKNAAAMVVLGDAKKGLKKRQEALNHYRLAEKNSSNYLEPLQKIVAFHAEDGNNEEALRYLKKLDRMSPLNCNRKIKIAELHIDQGEAQVAEEYFDNAIKSAQEEAMAVVGEMSLDIAELLAEKDPEMATKYYRQSLDFVKSAKTGMAMNIYNRLGISLRKQGLWMEAIEAYGEAAKHAPKDENIQYNIAMAYSEGGRHLECADKMQQALIFNPDMYQDKPALAYSFGAAFAKARRTNEARICLEYLQTISPGYKDSAALLRQVHGK